MLHSIVVVQILGISLAVIRCSIALSDDLFIEQTETFLDFVILTLLYDIPLF